MPNAFHDLASTLGSPHRFAMSDWASQPHHPRYPFPVSGQQFLPPSYSGQSILPPSYSGQNDLNLLPSSHVSRDPAVSLLNKFSPADAFASSNFEPIARSASSFPSSLQSNQSALQQQAQLQLAQMMNAQQQQQQQQLQFPSSQFSQFPQSIPTNQPTFQPLHRDSVQSFPTDPTSFEQLRRHAILSSRELDSAAYLREQDPFSISSPLGLNYPSTTISSLNTSIPSDPRAPTITSSTHTVSYSNLPAFPTAHGVMASQDLASFAVRLGVRPNPAHEWLTDNSAPPGIAVHQGPFITSLDTKVPLPPSPAGTGSSASLASPATANTSISSVSLDGYEVPSGPVAVRTVSGASGTPLSTPSSASPNVSPTQSSGGVAGGKRSREESLLSLSQQSEQESQSDARHLLFPQRPLSLSSLSSRSNPVSPSISSSSIARVPTPSGALTQSFTTISLSSVSPSEPPDPSSYLFQRPSPSTASPASLPECVSVSSLIFNRSNQYQRPRLSSSSVIGSSSLLPISIDDTLADGSTSPSKRVRSGPTPSPSSLSLPASSSFTPSGAPSLTWPSQSPVSRQFPSQPSVGGSAYPFNAVPTNRPSKKPGKADPKNPKNPRSAYVYFVADQRKKLAKTETLANSTFQEVASALGARWRALSPEERRPFEELARRDKERYQMEKSQSYDDM